MAGGKQSPRQKMINMMYLVLTALLALNISKEVLHAFVVVNIGLMQQKENLESKNDAAIGQFANEVTTNPKDQKRKELNQKAIEVGKIAKTMNDYIETMKVEMVKATEGISDEAEAKKRIANPFLIDRKDDYDRTTTYFGTNNPPGTSGKAAELKGKLTQYRTDLLKFVDGKNKAKIEKNLAVLELKLPEAGETKEGNHSTWEMFYFYHQPQSAALVELTKWQNIVRGAESEILTYLWDQISATSFKFDAVKAAIIPKSNFVTSGSNFEAEVFLAAYSTSVKPKITYGTAADSSTGAVTGGVDLTDDKIVDGKGLISIPVSGAGERTFGVTIKIVNPVTGAETPYTANTKYNVAPPSATVSATNMNVMYKGLANPIEVSVPGYAPNNVIVNCAGGSISGSNGKYNVTPGGGKELNISVSAKGTDGKTTSMGSYKFRVKEVPTPTIFWGGVQNGGKISGSAASGAALIPQILNFEFQAYATISSFTVAFKKGSNFVEEPVNGNQIPDKLRGTIQSLPKGTKVYFDQVKVNKPGGSRESVSAIFTIQ